MSTDAVGSVMRCGMARFALLWSITLSVGLLAGPPDASCGPVFVRERDVTVRGEPDAGATPVTNVEEGERLEVIETWHRVLLPSGKPGWVRSSDVFSPVAGSKHVALLFSESGAASAAEWGPVVSERFAERFGGQVEWLGRDVFGQMLADRGLSVEAAEAYPEDFVGFAEGVDGIVVCGCREVGGRARLDCRYVDMRVGGLVRREFALGEAGAVGELADQVAEQLHAGLRELLFPAAEEAQPVAALEAGGEEQVPETSLLEGMVLIPAGEFISLGTNGSKRAVRLDAFYLDKFEVTNAAYRAFDATYTYPEGEDDHPASGISWNQANAYAEWLGKRLPSEEEWEKACRYTDGRRYPWGDVFDAGRANINTTGTKPRGSYETGKSPYGVYDLIGNVWEWTSSPPAEGLRTRVLQGGAWSSNPPDEDTIFRYTAFPDYADDSFGFRCAVSAGTVPQQDR